MPANEVKELSEVYRLNARQDNDIELKRLPNFSPGARLLLW
jgi:hypothetical protein